MDLRIPHDAWEFVCGSRKALFLRKEGRSTRPKFKVEDHLVEAIADQLFDTRAPISQGDIGFDRNLDGQRINCVSACNFGSDSNLLHVAADLELVSTRNEHDGSAISASQPCSRGIDWCCDRKRSRRCSGPISHSGVPMS